MAVAYTKHMFDFFPRSNSAKEVFLVRGTRSSSSSKAQSLSLGDCLHAFMTDASNYLTQISNSKVFVAYGGSHRNYKSIYLLSNITNRSRVPPNGSFASCHQASVQNEDTCEAIDEN